MEPGNDITFTGFKSISRCPKINLRPRPDNNQIDTEYIVRDDDSNLAVTRTPDCHLPLKPCSLKDLSVCKTETKTDTFVTPCHNQCASQDVLLKSPSPIRRPSRTKHMRPLELPVRSILCLPSLWTWDWHWWNMEWFKISEYEDFRLLKEQEKMFTFVPMTLCFCRTCMLSL